MKINVEDYYRRYGPMVFRRCKGLLKDDDRAYDAMQEVFLKLLDAGDRLKHQYPSSLLYTIATNICLNIIKSEKRSLSIDVEDVLDNLSVTDDIAGRVIESDLLEKIFLDEKESTRDMAVMHFIDRMTYEEISEETGMSVSGIRKRLKKIQEKARKLLKEGAA